MRARASSLRPIRGVSLAGWLLLRPRRCWPLELLGGVRVLFAVPSLLRLGYARLVVEGARRQWERVPLLCLGPAPIDAL